MRVSEKSAEVIVAKKSGNADRAKDRRSQYRNEVKLTKEKREVGLEQREVTTTVTTLTDTDGPRVQPVKPEG